MADNQASGGRKPRSYYVDYTKRSSNYNNRRRGVTAAGNNSRFRDTPDVAFGNKGFLITSVDEVKCYLEMRNILEQYFEQIYNVQDQTEKEKTNNDDDLDSELKQLRKSRPFKQVKTHCRNTLFINITKEFTHVDPQKLVDEFFSELLDKSQMKTANTYKVLPVFDTFRNNVSCAKTSIAQLLNDRFKDESETSKKYFIELQSRGNHKLNPETKQSMIEGVADTVSELKPSWTVDRENADYIIILIALKDVCCLSVVSDYFKRCKYNVIELCKDFATSTNIDDAPKEAESQNDVEEKTSGDTKVENT